MIVTTFSPEGYEQYGKRFIDTYKDFCGLPLIVYVEDNLKIEGVDVRSLFDIPNCSRFLDIVKDYKPDNYRRNVNKFCRKVFAMTDVGLGFKGKMAFIGADTVFHKNIPDTFLDDILKDKYLAYLGRTKLHSETDFIAFNTEHVVNNLFMRLFVNTYTTGAYQHLKYYCDSDVFDHLRVLLNVSSNNINLIDDHRHPFINSVLGEYADHCKGPLRKKSGHSFEADYVNQ